MYALYDAHNATMTFHRVAYDHPAAVQALQRSGMPSSFAERLEQGR